MSANVKCNKPDFNRLAASCFMGLVKICYPQACCSKPADNNLPDFLNLHQHSCVHQTWLQFVPSDLSKLDIHRLDAS